MVATFNNYQELVDRTLMIEGKQQQIYPDPNCPGISFPIYHYSSQWRIQYFTGGDLVSIFGDFCIRSCGVRIYRSSLRLH